MNKIQSLDDVKLLVMEGSFPGYWGKGDTLAQALKNARNPKKYIVYLVHKSTGVDDSGQIYFPEGFPPREIFRKPLA